MTTENPTTIDQKTMVFIQGGYSITSPAPISFGSFTQLWCNPELNMYILKQPISVNDTPTNITLNGLINPEAFQMEQYSSVNTISMTFYDKYHPHTNFLFEQPPFSFFVSASSLVGMNSITYSNDIRTQIPSNTPSIVSMKTNIQ